MKKGRDLVVAIFGLPEDLELLVSQTFITAHIERLPFTVIANYGNESKIVNASGLARWFWSSCVGPVARRLSPDLYRWIAMRRLARFLLKTGADAVLAEYGWTGSWLAPACEKANIPLFVHFHGADASAEEILASHRASYARFFQSAAGVVAVSKAMRERLLSLGAPEDRLHLNPYGVDPERFSGGAPADHGPKFFAVGRFVEKKAPYLTILAFSRVLEEVPQARLTMVGNGPLFGPCKRLVQALGIGESVELLGVKGPDEVSEQMRTARAFVQHSLVAETGDSEGTPVAVIEAQMTGIPVVSTRHAGIPDVVIDGVSGILVDEGDVAGMADAMIRLARDPDLAARMGIAARVRALAHFTLERHLGQLAEMIEEGVARHRSSTV